MKKNWFDYRKELNKETDNVCNIINCHPSLVHLFTSDDKGKVKINLRYSNWIMAEIDENEIRNPSYATSIGILNFIKYFNEKKDFEDYNNGIGGISGKIISFLSKVFTS